MKKVIKLVRTVRGRRGAAKKFRALRAQRGPLKRGTFTIGVYFADSDVNLYQMRQWYAPLLELSKTWPVLVIARNAVGAEAIMRESGLEVEFAPNVPHLEELVARQPLSVVFYVNQNTRNFQMLRYGNRWHVFINHGESDKMYMSTNQFKAYDYAFVAGSAAKERLNAKLWNYDVEDRTFAIGRPQTDFTAGQAPYPLDERITVLYAPTWEGDRPGAAYGSVLTHGLDIARQVLASPEHRFVYRPHPRTGVLDEQVAKAHREIISMIEQANKEHPTAHHQYDTAPTLTWQLSLTDVAICDISAMIYDRLATGKPIIVTKPAAPKAVVDRRGFLSVCEWIEAADAPRVLGDIDRVLHDPHTRSQLEHWSAHYFGDTTAGAPMRRFAEATEELMQRYEQLNQSHK